VGISSRLIIYFYASDGRFDLKTYPQNGFKKTIYRALEFYKYWVDRGIGLVYYGA